MRLVLEAEVRDRIAKEAEWYRSRRPGLEDDLLQELGKAFERIVNFPYASQWCIGASGSTSSTGSPST